MRAKFIKQLDAKATKEKLLEVLKTHLPNINLEDVEKDIFINSFIYVLGLEIDKVNYRLQNQFIDYAEGEYLDALCANFGLTRIRQTSAKGKMTIYTKKAGVIPKGFSFLSTQGDISKVDVETPIKEGINVIVLSANKEGQLNTTIPDYPLSFLSDATFETGNFNFESYEEDDDTLRKRYKKSIFKYSAAGSAKAYEYFASEAGAQRVKIASDEPGEVKIYFTGISGIETKIKEGLADFTPLTDSIKLIRVNQKEIDLDIQIKTSKDHGEIENEIRKRLHAAFGALEIGEGLSQNLLISKIFVPGVSDGNITGYEAPEEFEILTLGNINITYMS